MMDCFHGPQDNIVKINFPPARHTRSVLFLSKYEVSFLGVDTDKNYILKSIRKVKGTRIVKPILRKNERGGIILDDFKTYNILIKTVRHWSKDRGMEWNRIE